MTTTNTLTKDTLATMTAEQIFQAVAGGEQMRGAVSKTIRFLDSLNIPRGTIAKMLGKRYQHVKNVLDEPLKNTMATLPPQADEATPENDPTAE